MTDARPSQWTAAVVLFGILFLGVSDTQLIGPLLPSITRDLNLSTAWASALVTGYAISAALFALLLGTASDRYGRKSLLCLALAGFAIASLVTFQSSYLITLLIARMLTGVSAGTLSTLALSTTADVYPYQRRGRAMGIVSMGYFLAFIISIPVASLVTGQLGWRWVFLVLALASAAMLIITIQLLPSDRRHAFGRRYLGFSRHFLVRDRAAGIAAAFLTSGGLFGFITYVGLWLADLGIRDTLIFYPYMVAGVLATGGSLVSGGLSDRVGKKKVVIGANLILAPLFLVVSGSGWNWGLFVWIGALGFASGARQGPLHALTTELVPTEERGSYVAVRNAASQLGIACTVVLAAIAFDHSGFAGVGWISALLTLLIVPACLMVAEPGRDTARPSTS